MKLHRLAILLSRTSGMGEKSHNCHTVEAQEIAFPSFNEIELGGSNKYFYNMPRIRGISYTWSGDPLLIFLSCISNAYSCSTMCSLPIERGFKHSICNFQMNISVLQLKTYRKRTLRTACWDPSYVPKLSLFLKYFAPLR